MMVREYLEVSETRKLEDVAKTPRDRLLIRLLSRLNCPVSEALGITIDDIDLSAGTITIVHLKSRVWVNCRQCGEKLGLRHDFCPKCGTKNQLNATMRSEKRRQRSLPLDSATANLIREFITQGGPVSRNGKLYLFDINRHRAWQILKQASEKAGLPKLVNPETGKIHNVSPHKLRDAFAVNAVKRDDSGDGLRLLQEHLGHQSFNTTAKYRKVAGEEHKAWYEKLWR